jgi:membrane-associated protease RseP (regulator of RpoE activity)
MAGVVGQFAFFFALIVVIVIHEAAHFGMAKWFGIKVQEFFVGFGPRIWTTRRGETEYGFKWIPAGGYVKIAGMNPYETVAPEDEPRTFGAKPIWQRALVIVAGPATHFVLAFLFFAMWLGFVGQPDIRSPVILRVVPTLEGVQSPASSSGLRAGERIVAIGGVEDPTDLELVRVTREHVGKPVTLVVERDGQTREVTVVPVLSEVAGERVGRIGVLLGQARERAGVVGSVTGGASSVGDSMVQTVQNMGRIFGPEGVGRVARLLFTDAPREVTDAASVVGIGKVAAQTASGRDSGDLLYLFAFVNVFIGLLNLLPLPPFDGGHLTMLAIEKVRGRPVDVRKVIPISVAVVTFFIIFTVSVVYLDITKPITLVP